MSVNQIVNKEGSAEHWAADVIYEGIFAGRLSVTTNDGIQTVHLRLDPRTTGCGTLGTWESLRGRLWSVDDIEDMIFDALHQHLGWGVGEGRTGGGPAADQGAQKLSGSWGDSDRSRMR